MICKHKQDLYKIKIFLEKEFIFSEEKFLICFFFFALPFNYKTRGNFLHRRKKKKRGKRKKKENARSKNKMTLHYIVLLELSASSLSLHIQVFTSQLGNEYIEQDRPPCGTSGHPGSIRPTEMKTMTFRLNDEERAKHPRESVLNEWRCCILKRDIIFTEIFILY